MSPLILDCLQELMTVTAERDIPSKDAKEFLLQQGYAQRACGFVFLTEKGVKVLYHHDRLKIEETMELSV